MPRGFDRPTSSSLSRSTNAGAREPLQQSSAQTKSAQYETPVVTQNTDEQPQTLAARRKPTHSALLLPQLLNEPQPDSPARKTPSYLQGKNPYGQVLDQLEHPYREPKGAAAGPPSQAGASVSGRPRTSGSFEFKTRVPPIDSDRTASAPIAEQNPAPLRQLTKPVSVGAARQLFESRAAQDRQGPLLPPARPAFVGSVSVKEKAQVKHNSSLKNEAEVLPPSVVVRKASEFSDSLDSKDLPVAQDPLRIKDDSTARRRSTNIFDAKSRDVKFPNGQRQVDKSTYGSHEPCHASLAALGRRREANDLHRAEEPVSRPFSLTSVPVAETGEEFILESRI
jgi:hypothetical protein